MNQINIKFSSKDVSLIITKLYISWHISEYLKNEFILPFYMNIFTRLLFD